jgi:hypothetical protein
MLSIAICHLSSQLAAPLFHNPASIVQRLLPSQPLVRVHIRALSLAPHSVP